MIGIWYFVIYILIVLVLWAIPYTRNILKVNFPELIYSASGYIWLLADIKSSSEELLISEYTWKQSNLFLIIMGCTVAFIGFIIAYRRNGLLYDATLLQERLDLEKKKKEKIKEEYYSLCSNNIRQVFREFYDTSNGNARVSIYKHHASHFTLLGRYATNPLYNNINLGTYPDNEGFISLAWQQPTFEVHGIPAWIGRGREYKNFVEGMCTMSRARWQQISMKSRSFYIIRIEQPNQAQNPLGIVVFEKIEDTIIDAAIIGSIITLNNNQITFLLQSMSSLDRIDD